MKEERIAVMRISGLPRRKRMAVEEAMVASLLSEPFDLIPGTDPLDWAECTRWWRNPRLAGCVDCRQVLNGTAEEFEALQVRIDAITGDGCAVEFEFMEQREAIAV